MDEVNIRLDKWLWAARFFKTRALAKEAIVGGKVRCDGLRTRPSHTLKTGATLSIRKGPYEWIVRVQKCASRRGPAKEAERLYEETAPSQQQRRDVALALKTMAQTTPTRRPDKKERRTLAQLRGKG